MYVTFMPIKFTLDSYLLYFAHLCVCVGVPLTPVSSSSHLVLTRLWSYSPMVLFAYGPAYSLMVAHT